VRYVLEGSVRKAGNRVRVTAQLIEAETGNHIWAERYDRELADLFDLQDELTEAISAQVDAELAGSERALAYKKPTTDLDAWELYQRGMWHFYKYSKDDFIEARRLLLLASERAPDFANAYAGLTIVGSSETVWGFGQDRARVLEQGLRDAEKAVTLDDRDGNNQFALGIVCMVLGDGERAIPALEKSVDLNPSSAASHYGLGMALFWFGRAQDALSQLTLAMRLSPHDPRLWLFHSMRSYAHIVLDEFDLAISDAKAAIQSKRDIAGPHMALAAAYTLSGQHDEARAAYDRAQKLNPEFSAADFTSMMGTVHPPYFEIILEALQQAGTPEE
ncbi:MAG: tetratricopeptide repeat protein, partial [Alphaproteobacteria bacterium]|nr:tetratricopeptide repeat protein [Alphaproteobacteria bacterium]